MFKKLTLPLAVALSLGIGLTACGNPVAPSAVDAPRYSGYTVGSGTDVVPGDTLPVFNGEDAGEDGVELQSEGARGSGYTIGSGS